jgi:RHS repeat-associated protein
MEPALSTRIPDGFMAALRLGGEKPHQGVRSQNPAPNQVREVCNFTVLLGLQAAAVLNRVGSRSTGKERDSESGNDYFGARYYASSMGRFMSPDWSAKVAPVPYAKLDDPQSLNLYAYVRNNPLVRVDADGHIDWDYLTDKFKDIFYVKVSVEGGVGGGVKVTKEFKAEAKATIGMEVKKTRSGETTTLKAEATAGIKAGNKEAGVKASAEMQVEKDGKMDIKKPTFQCCTPSAGAGHAEATPNEIEVSGHDGAFGGAVGADLDKAKEFGEAVKQQVNSEVNKYVKKILPN